MKNADRILMLKDTEVYNIDKEKILNYDLLPIYLKEGRKDINLFLFNKWWFNVRRFPMRNAPTRILQARAYGFGKNVMLDRLLSLNDSYWVKARNEDILFEEVTPYKNDFYKWGSDISFRRLPLNNKSIPSLYLRGMSKKEWINSKHLLLESDVYFYPSYLLAKQLGFEVADYILTEDINKIISVNFTNTDTMFELLEDFEGFRDNIDASEMFNKMKVGKPRFALDIILGCHTTSVKSFGFLRDANTGKIIKEAPIFGFRGSLQEKDPKKCDLIEIAFNYSKDDPEFKEILIDSCNRTLNVNTLQEFKNRAKYILKYIK